MAGIISYGSYIPKYRIKTADIAHFWNKNLGEALGVAEKSTPALDEDAVTMGIEAAYRAFRNGKIDLAKIKAISMGSESHPYAVKPSSTIIGEILGIPHHHYIAVDTQFACKAATAALRLLSMMEELKKDKVGLVIGSDAAQAKPGDALEYTAAAAAVALMLGNTKVIAEILDSTSYSSDTPDFWRRDGQPYPSHAGRFTGEPAYFQHVLSASSHLLEKTKMKPKDFTSAIFHMPNAKFPTDAAKRLGFTPEQIETGLIVKKIGNPYSASALTGLCAVLDVAKPGDKIFMCSYGSGSGADAFVFEVTPEILKHQKNNRHTVNEQVENKEYASYEEVVRISSQKGGH